MSFDEIKPRSIFIIGPTAVGKTHFSINLAETLQGEIVSADSRLFYRGMDIGTDKPAPDVRARVPHHLIDIAQPDEVLSLAEFQTAARTAIEGIHAREKIPFIVGGSGQYFRALTEGWVIPRQEPNYALRKELEDLVDQEGAGALLDRLRVVDPRSAERIDSRNTRRMVRALEVSYSTGQPFSEQRLKGQPFLDPLIVGLIRPREELYARIDKRIDQMFASGFVEEVKGLLEQGYSPDLPSFSAIGYQEVSASLNGQIDMDEAVVLMKRRSRQMVRRQSNWFKADDPDIHWCIPGDESRSEIESKIRTFMRTREDRP